LLKPFTSPEPTKPPAPVINIFFFFILNSLI